MTKLQCDVLGIGSVVIDHQVVLERYPQENSKASIEASRLQVGGPVPTALVLLSRFGHDCAFLGAWADDHHGRMITQDLADEGIDHRHACTSADPPTGSAHVWISRERATRTIVNSRGSGADETNLPVYNGDMPYSCRVLHLDGMFPGVALAAARQTRSESGTVVLDTGNPKPGLDELLEHVDVAICPQHFPRAYSGSEDEPRAAAELLDRGPRCVIVTHGDRGAVLYTADEQIRQPAHPVEALDTTGAGDVFCGGIIYGCLAGFDWPRCLRFASVAAALKCRQLGNREALPELEAVLKVN